MTTFDKIAALKGYQKIEAIEKLASNEKNAEILLNLAKTQKGDTKDAALRALASLNSPVANEIWQEMISKNGRGEKVFTGAIGDGASDAVAKRARALFEHLASKDAGYALTQKEFNEFKAMITMMCGKASDAMCDLYRFIAQNHAKFSRLKFPANALGAPSGYINRYLNLNPNLHEQKAKIFPIALMLSLVLNLDERLINLACELDEEFGEEWLCARFAASLLTKDAASNFNEFAPLLNTPKKPFLLDALAVLYYDPDDLRHVAIIDWGRYEYARIDTVVYEDRALKQNLDERWYEALTQTEPIKVHPQAYMRTYVKYGAYDELLAAIVPNANALSERAREVLTRYFTAGEASYDGQSSVYIDTLNRLGADVSEAMMMKFILCPANAASEHSAVRDLDMFTSWDAPRKLKFYESLPKWLINASALAGLKRRRE